MAGAELTRLTLERFKSHADPTRLELAPLTVLLGRNNSGKSSLIQPLLLLRQTLAHPRPGIPLHLEGAVDALHLRELTYGRPDAGDFVSGPVFELEWESDVDVRSALGPGTRRPDLRNLAQNSDLPWLIEPPDSVRLKTSFRVLFCESEGSIVVSMIDLRSERVDTDPPISNPAVTIAGTGLPPIYSLSWRGSRASRLEVELDHFIPLVHLDKRNVGPQHPERAWHHGFKVLYEQPLEDLRQLIGGFHYLGSTRTLPSSIYRPAAAPPEDVGVSGEYAAQMLHARKIDVVHFVSPPGFHGGKPRFPEQVLSRRLPAACNLVMHELGIQVDLEIDDIANVGFRLLFGGASLSHVGRGIGYLLPTVLLGLVSDPLRFREPTEDLLLADYLKRCPTVTHAAIEEPETHLHPKVQTRLAHWFVALAMAGRRLIVETHSDHLVRRLRGLIARVPADSELERWLANNVVIAEIEQAEDGRSHLSCSRLTATGGIAERWPADFMEEAADEERWIYFAGLEKSDDSEAYAADTELIHDPVDE
ncbi:MAG: AAA family ATPase [bacterium]|nr:AAA family ATPase [bacterium]